MAGPLADRMRPTNIDEVCGQKDLLADGKPLRRIIESGEIPNLIFYGPSGVGKTTVANIIAARCGKKLHRLNATTASVSDIKDIISSLGTFESANGVLLYLDEIQYFSKKQQQILLEYIENGDITLIASTTENPYFYVYNAVLSRSTVFEFKALEPNEIVPALSRAFEQLEKERNVKYEINPDVLLAIAERAGGDVRRALNTAELCAITAEKGEAQAVITMELALSLSGAGAVKYDREGDDHYDIISAYQKSMRGSDPDAALHYLARLLAAGDMPSACRRLLVCANEDVGLAYPQIIPIVKAAVDTALQLGLPEARIPLANAVVLVATAPKSNSAYLGLGEALSDIESGKAGPVPRNLQNKHFDGEERDIKGQFYLYPHDYKNHYVAQQYLPDNLLGKKYYVAGNNKNERSFAEYLEKIKDGGEGKD